MPTEEIINMYPSTNIFTDFAGLPPNTNVDIQPFFCVDNNVSTQTWNKPRGATMCYMLCISSGAGGGAGFTRATTVAGGGGGGGACGGIATALYPAVILPDELHVVVPMGGKGGLTSGTAGGAGANAYISTGKGLTNFNAIPNIILESGATTPGGGGAGSGAAAGAAGTVPTIGTKARSGWAGALAVGTNYTVGLVGLIGGAQTGANGAASTAVWNAIPVSPGTGGAGVNAVNTGFAGGALSLQGVMDYSGGTFAPSSTFLAGGTAGSNVLVGGNGNSGIQSWKPFIMTGGTGGGSADGQVGGAGGNGGIGCGGGGGGAGTTGGRGGDGGNGLVVIISW